MFLTAKSRKRHSLPGQVDVDCSWCGSGVPLPPGEFSGVCIDCGTVMFRPLHIDRHESLQMAGSDIPGNGGSMMPATA